MNNCNEKFVNCRPSAFRAFGYRLVCSASLVLMLLNQNAVYAKPPTLLELEMPSSVGIGEQKRLYYYQLLHLALENTRERYGDFSITFTPDFTINRASRYLQQNPERNFVFATSYRTEYNKTMSFVDFPVELGIVGYRVCFVSPKKVKKVKNAKTLEALRRFTIGQGAGWHDVEVLRHNGFKVAEYGRTMHLMVATGRFDLFCRGANELKIEWEQYHDLVNLHYDTSMAFYYPLPRFFWVNKHNEALKNRIESGLKIAYQKGTLIALWEQHFMESVKFAKLENRRVHELDNPALDNINSEFSRYIYRPKIVDFTTSKGPAQAH